MLVFAGLLLTRRIPVGPVRQAPRDDHLPGAVRRQLIAARVAMGVVGAMIMPSLVTSLGWEAVFWINVPVSILTALVWCRSTSSVTRLRRRQPLAHPGPGRQRRHAAGADGRHPDGQAGVGSALNSTVQQAGAALGVAILGSLATSSCAFLGAAADVLGAAVLALLLLRGRKSVAHAISEPQTLVNA